MTTRSDDPDLHHEVETAARTLHAGSGRPPWDDLEEEERERFRAYARSVLDLIPNPEKEE